MKRLLSAIAFAAALAGTAHAGERKVCQLSTTTIGGQEFVRKQCHHEVEPTWIRGFTPVHRSVDDFHSRGYSKNRINSPFPASVDDWNDAFAGGGGESSGN